MKIKPSKISKKEIIEFSIKMSKLLSAGISLQSALNIVLESTSNRDFNQLLEMMKRDIGKGAFLTKSLQKFPTIFDKYYHGMILVGEQSGKLDNAFERISLHYEKQEDLKRKIKKAIYYPCIILLTSIIVTVYILLRVVPSFNEIFISMKVELPLSTRILLSLSKNLSSFGSYILALISCIFFAGKFLFKKNDIKLKVQAYILALPFFGKIFKKIIILHFLRSWSLLISANIHIIESLNTVISSSKYELFARKIISLQSELQNGMPFKNALIKLNFFTNELIEMLSIAFESGKLEAMLFELATSYEKEVDHTLSALTTLLEPLIMILIGILVCSMLIALYQPIFKMGDVF